MVRAVERYELWNGTGCGTVRAVERYELWNGTSWEWYGNEHLGTGTHVAPRRPTSLTGKAAQSAQQLAANISMSETPPCRTSHHAQLPLDQQIIPALETAFSMSMQP